MTAAFVPPRRRNGSAHVYRLDPDQSAFLDGDDLTGGIWHLAHAGDERGETPPSRLWHTVRKHAVRVGLNHSGLVGIRRNLNLAVADVLDLDAGERRRLAVIVDDAAEHVAGPQCERACQWADFDRRTRHRVPPIVLAV